MAKCQHATLVSKPHNNKGQTTETKRKRPRPLPVVEVVSCGSAFPISTKPPKASHEANQTDDTDTRHTGKGGRKSRLKNGDDTLLDWHDTVKQVRELGTTGFVGRQKRDHENDQYKRLTGREKKKHQVPLPIVRGIKKKAAAREARQIQEAKDAGIVMPKAKSQRDNDKKKGDSTNRVHGPAPSIGFMKKGIYRFKKSENR